MDNSPLKRLPAELLNRIAELALYHEGGVKIWHLCTTESTPEPLSISAKSAGEGAALTFTCKQLRHNYLHSSSPSTPSRFLCPRFTWEFAPMTATKCELEPFLTRADHFIKAIGPDLAGTMGKLVFDVDLGATTYPSPPYEPFLSTIAWIFISHQSIISNILAPCKTAQIQVRFTNTECTQNLEHCITLDWHDMAKSL